MASLALAPVSCSDTLDSPLEEVAFPTILSFVVGELAWQAGDEGTHATANHRR